MRTLCHPSIAPCGCQRRFVARKAAGVSGVMLLARSQVCGRPVWVPGSIINVKGIKTTHYASISPEELSSIEVCSS